MGTPWYCTREEVQSALDSKSSAYDTARVDRACRAGTAAVEALTRRVFYPRTEIRYEDFPDRFSTPVDEINLPGDLISLSALTAGGEAIPTTDVILRPNSGPPYTWAEVDLSTSSAFQAGDTEQNAIAITGTWGYGADTEPAGALAEALDISETLVDVTDSASVGVGDAIKVDSEYMVISGKSLLDTGQTLQTPLTASMSNVSVVVSDGSAYSAGEVILLDGERMLIVDIAGNALTVKRAYDGSVLAAHTGSTVYAPRTLRVDRGALGTTAAAHNVSAAILRHVAPADVRSLALAESIARLLGEATGYAKVGGHGEGKVPAIGAGLPDLRNQVASRYRRVFHLAV